MEPGSHQIFSCMAQETRVHSQMPVRPCGATGNFLRGVLRSAKNEYERTWTCGTADFADHFGIRSVLWGGDGGGFEDLRGAWMLWRGGDYGPDGAKHPVRGRCAQYSERDTEGAARCAGEGFEHCGGEDRNAGQPRERYDRCGIFGCAHLSACGARSGDEIVERARIAGPGGGEVFGDRALEARER